MHSRRIRLVTLLVILAAFAAALVVPAWILQPDKAAPEARNGVLDLRDWSLEEDGAVRLNGIWQLHWNRLLPEAAEAANEGAAEPAGHLLANVPGVWTRYGLPGTGYATYRLKVLTQGDTGALGLQIPAIAPAYTVYVDGKEVARTGRIAESKDKTHSAYEPQTVFFVPPPGPFVLDVQVANAIYPEGGIWFSLTLGTDSDMQRMKERMTMIDMIVFGGCALLGLYQISVFLLRRTERSTLYFGICCLLGAVRQWVVGGIYLVELFPEIDIRLIIMLEYLTYYGGVTMAVLFVRELYPKEFHAGAAKLLAAIGALYVAAVLLLPTEIYTRSIDSFKYISLVALGYIVYGFFAAALAGRGGALLQFTGWLVFVASAVHDISYSNGWMIGGDWQLVPYGFMLLVFIEALELARRFTDAYRTIGRMSNELIAMDRVKDEFLANTSHELKTPLHGILNLTAALSEGRSGPINGAQKEQLEVVVSVARRMSNLINDILDLSLLKNNGIQLHLQSVDVRAVVSAQEEVFRHYIGSKPVALRLEWPERLPRALADENRLLQILYNLIGNAIKFTHRGEVVVSARAEGALLSIAVADTGIGIPADKQASIFQAFEQAGTSMAKEYGGAGLGLGITRRLVELHGGQLLVASKVGEGSVFTFTLPVADTASLGRGQESGPGLRARGPAAERLKPGRLEPAAGDSKRGAAAHPGRIILAVDDDPVNLRVLTTVLADEPYEVIVAASGLEALELLESLGDEVGLVILDVMMPGLSGFETCRRLREKYGLSELPVLLTTVRSDSEDLMYGFDAGANDFLTKPFEPHELRARARTLLEMKRSSEEAIRSETAFLQAQIKPHFLYNALNTIISLSLDEPQTAHDLLLHLSRYLRGSFDFNSKQKLVTMQQELELAEAYLQIEQARFGDRLRIRYEVEDAAACLLPHTTLQPLVENAVRHGLMKKEEGGTITVAARAEESYAVISVTDDGAGMQVPAHAILASEGDGGGGVGLRNIHKRLLRLYGRGLDIESESGKGTRVSFRVPLAMDNRDAERGWGGR